MATFRKRGPSRWEAQVRRRGWPTRTSTFHTKADAQAWAADTEAAMHKGAYADDSVLKSTTVRALLQRYLVEEVPKKKGSESEGWRLQAFMRQAFADLPLSEIDSNVMAAWRNERLKLVSAPTVRRDLILLSHIFTVARKEWKFKMVNPLEDVRRPSSAPHRKRIPSWSEKKRLLRKLTTVEAGQCVPGAARNPWIRPLVTLALRTAMRRSEILALRWEHVHVALQYAHLPDTKNGDERDVPLTRKALLILSRLPQAETGPVFPVSAEAVKQAFKRAQKRAKIDNLRLHDMRHAAATNLAKKLSNVLELSAVTGHKSLAMLKIYYQPDPTDLAKKLDA